MVGFLIPFAKSFCFFEYRADVPDPLQLIRFN